MTKKCSVTKVVVQIGDIAVELTPEEAIGLRDAMLKMFPQAKDVQYVPYWQPSITPARWGWGTIDDKGGGYTLTCGAYGSGIDAGGLSNG